MMGCSHAIMKIWGRIAHLSHQVSSTPDDWLDRTNTVYELESELRSMYCALSSSGVSTSPIAGETPQQELSETQPSSSEHSRTLEWCFYWTTQLLIIRRLYGESSQSRPAQHAVSVSLRLLKSLPLDSSVNSAVSLPFFLTAREILCQDDRDWIRERHEQMKGVYPNPARSAMMALTEDLWATLDRSDDQSSEHLEALDGEIERQEKDVLFFVF